MKLPKPVGQYFAPQKYFDVDAPTDYEKSIGWEAIYTEAQLKQAVRDALEEAIKTLEGLWHAKDDSTQKSIAAIRALIKEIE